MKKTVALVIGLLTSFAGCGPQEELAAGETATHEQSVTGTVHIDTVLALSSDATCNIATNCVRGKALTGAIPVDTRYGPKTVTQFSFSGTTAASSSAGIIATAASGTALIRWTLPQDQWGFFGVVSNHVVGGVGQVTVGAMRVSFDLTGATMTNLSVTPVVGRGRAVVVNNTYRGSTAS